MKGDIRQQQDRHHLRRSSHYLARGPNPADCISGAVSRTIARQPPGPVKRGSVSNYKEMRTYRDKPLESTSRSDEAVRLTSLL